MRHIFVSGEYSADRLATAARLEPVDLVPAVDVHRRYRGPYTAAGTVLRALVPQMLDRWPELVHAHDVEVLSVSPELRETVPATRETLTSLAIPKERTRFYSRLRTLRIAHGITELIRDHLHRLGGPARKLVVDNAHEADHTDMELLTVMLRRLDPALLTLVVCARPDDVAEPLASALSSYAQTQVAPLRRRAPTADAGDAELAALYVETDCASDDPALAAAYHRLDPTERAALHDDRADALESRAERSLALGAVPYHRERGSDPAERGAAALREALDYSINMGFYHATIDFGQRGRAIIDWTTQMDMWWAFTTKMTTSLASLSRAEEAEALYDEARAFSDHYSVHYQAAYATAMLYTRHHAAERRDLTRARAWINEALAFSALLKETGATGFQMVFQRNGRALIEMHSGNLPGALRLVESGIDLLDRELGADEHRLHRSVLLHNRAQVLTALGRLTDALADYTTVIAHDPNYAEYYFDRGNLLHKLGRDDEALADYASAIRLSPPFPEVYYNRADVLLGRGETEAARADLDYVLELDPSYVDAYVNRAGILLAEGEVEAARRDVADGLELAPDNAYLHCLSGQLQTQAGDSVGGREAYLRALDLDPTLVPAWASRAALAFETGDPGTAVSCLDRALELGDDAALRYNRAIAHRAEGNHAAALADLSRAAELDPYDEDVREELARYGRDLAQPTVGAGPVHG